jgi:hypothetical protein
MKVNRNGKKFNITKKKKKGGKKGYPTLKKKPKMNANETRSPEAIAIDGGLVFQLVHGSSSAYNPIDLLE